MSLPAQRAGIVKYLKQMFCRFGVPRRAKSDNGPYCACVEFRDIADKWGLCHATSTKRVQSPRYLVVMFVCLLVFISAITSV